MTSAPHTTDSAEVLQSMHHRAEFAAILAESGLLARATMRYARQTGNPELALREALRAHTFVAYAATDASMDAAGVTNADERSDIETAIGLQRAALAQQRDRKWAALAGRDAVLLDEIKSYAADKGSEDPSIAAGYRLARVCREDLGRFARLMREQDVILTLSARYVRKGESITMSLLDTITREADMAGQVIASAVEYQRPLRSVMLAEIAEESARQNQSAPAPKQAKAQQAAAIAR